jgi:hypothetical protein
MAVAICLMSLTPAELTAFRTTHPMLATAISMIQRGMTWPEGNEAFAHSAGATASGEGAYDLETLDPIVWRKFLALQGYRLMPF